MKIKTSELQGAALDWAVAKSSRNLSHKIALVRGGVYRIPQLRAQEGGWWCPSTNWTQGGPIIERERIATYFDYVNVTTESGKEVTVENGWKAHITPRRYWMTPQGRASGPTPLIAAMRCYVASRFGDEVEIPNELIL